MKKLESLWQGAQYQDNLLQAYRSYHLITQSILIAIGSGLSVAIISTGDFTEFLTTYVLLFLITGLGIYLLYKLRKLISARAEDVDYFHNQIIDFEQSLDKQDRTLTAFKVYQKFNRQQTNIKEYFSEFDINAEAICQLTEKGKGTYTESSRHQFI
ncbi:MAG: hypothetical protein U5L96_11770 [Owenweeksia sp.]|nr:hypothetical protein [Owenweeksia sp.]